VAHLIDVTNAGDGYRDILSRIMDDGQVVSPRGLATKALRNVTIFWRDPGDVLVSRPKLSRGLMALEPLQLVGGFSDPGLTVDVVPHYANFREPTGIFHGAYGLRVRDKVGLIAERLKQDKYTRQAHMNIWEDHYDLAIEGKKDYPCTTAAEFEWVDGVGLCGTTYMRSNDAWLGFPYDIVQHTSLLKSLATFLDLPVGVYTHVVRNLHIYETDFAKVAEFLASPPFPGARRLDGGFGAGTEVSWFDVQKRAKTITYRPTTIEPATTEEAFHIEAMVAQLGVAAP
jgi:thymidylate synthase